MSGPRLRLPEASAPLCYSLGIMVASKNKHGLKPRRMHLHLLDLKVD